MTAMIKVERFQRKFRKHPPSLVRVESCTRTRKKRRPFIMEYLKTPPPTLTIVGIKETLLYGEEKIDRV